MKEVVEALRKYLPPDWDVRVENGRLEVREWADRPAPLFNFDATRHTPAELLKGLPEIIGAMIAAMHREFCGLRDFAKEAVAGCADPGNLAGPNLSLLRRKRVCASVRRRRKGEEG